MKNEINRSGFWYKHKNKIAVAMIVVSLIFIVLHAVFYSKNASNIIRVLVYFSAIGAFAAYRKYKSVICDVINHLKDKKNKR
jgi:membrane protease YdiL (CAAX protease family)